MPAGRLTVTTAPSVEPVTTALVKEWLRVDTNDTSQDSVLELLVTACRSRVEEYINGALITQTLTWEVGHEAMRQPIFLPRVPATSITSLTTYDADGNSTLVSSANYELVGRTKIAYRSDGWDILRRDRAATIVYAAGYGTSASDVPYDIRLAILRLAADYYEFREGIVSGTTAVELPEGVTQLLEPYRWQFL